MEAFNLRDERDGGFFDENMNYVFKKEKGEVDAWVAEMDEATMEQAIGEAARAVKRKAIEREREEARDALKEFIPSIRLKQELLTFMQPKETVSAAMRRLSGKNGEIFLILLSFSFRCIMFCCYVSYIHVFQQTRRTRTKE